MWDAMADSEWVTIDDMAEVASPWIKRKTVETLLGEARKRKMLDSVIRKSVRTQNRRRRFFCRPPLPAPPGW